MKAAGLDGTSDEVGSRSVDRLINFSDAVVAVAVTVLALPLVDIEGPGKGENAWNVLSDHAGQIWSFLFTFYVIAIVWAAHNRILNGLRRYDGMIFWVNTTWLVSIVLMPWFSAMYGESEVFGSGGAEGGGVGLLYWANLAFVSALGTLMGRHLRRHPELAISRDSEPPGSRARASLRGPVFAGYFLAIGVATLYWPEAATWLPLGIIPLTIWLSPGRADGSGSTDTN